METETKVAITGSAIFALILICLIALGMWGCPQYTVYTQRLAGQAEYERAEQNRRIKIEEAKAHMESAKLYADSERERAKGTADANATLMGGLGGPEGYLRWRYIMMLEETGKGNGRETIYVPTEANLPILEAGRKK